MKKNLLFLAFALISLTVSAQHTTPAAKVQQQQIAVSAPLHFGYFSFDKVFHTMPGYAIAKHNMDELREKYDAETKRVETEFNAKYEEFLDGQRTYAKTILEKRQAELRELMEKNIAFKAEATRLLQQAENDAYAPLKAKINEEAKKIGKQKGFAFIINTDNNAAPYLNEEMGGGYYSFAGGDFEMMLPSNPGPIGVFDSGYGGLTILHGLRQTMPQYDYMYLGDNARAPYGSRSFEVVYKFTRQAVLKLFSMGCHLVILGCNTASAKALRSLQQRDIPELDPSRRVLGIIRPTAEVIGTITKSNHVGLLATEGTIKSQSYNMEISKLWPEIQVSGVACPLWAAIVEANEADSPGADYFVKKRIDQLMLKDADIDTIILGCTHYPLLMSSIVKNLPDGVRVVPQGQYVANSLKDYLNRHPQMEQMITKTGSCRYLTTESEDKFKESAQIFLHEQVEVTHVDLE